MEFSRENDGYYLGRTKEYGHGPFIVMGLTWQGCGVVLAKLGERRRFGSFHEENLVRNELLSAAARAIADETR